MVKKFCLSLVVILALAAVLVWFVYFRDGWRPVDLSDMPPSLPQTLPGGSLNVPGWVAQDGEGPFPTKKYLMECVSPGDNAAPEYCAAMADVCVGMDFMYPADAWQKRRSDVIQFQKEILDVASHLYGQKSAKPSVEKMERVLANARPTLAKLARAQEKKRCEFVSAMNVDAPLPHLEAANVLSILGRIQLEHANATGNGKEAESAVSQMLRLARDLRPRGQAMCQLYSAGIERTVFRGIVESTLAQKGLTPQDCDRLALLLAEHKRECLSLVEETLRAEYVLIRIALSDLQQGGPRREVVVKSFSMESMPLDKIDWAKEVSTAKQVFVISRAFLSQPYYRVAIGEFQRKELWKLLREAPLVNEMVSQRPLYKALRRFQSEDMAAFNGTLCLVAVRRYMLTHGKPPECLADAVKEAKIGSVPEDPYDGKPMRYALVDGKPTVYSVGHDRVDHGGRKSWKGGGQPGDIIFRVGEASE